MKYMTTQEASEKWHISTRRIRILCETGRIEGAIKIGRNWSVPQDAEKPLDARISIKHMFSGLNQDFSMADCLKNQIDTHRPLKSEVSKTLQEKLIVEWTYHSNGIEGNTLTISETKVVLEGITIGGKSVVEHLEAINHKEAILFLEDIVAKKEAVTEWNIRSIHALILKEIDNDNAGKYRTSNVLISGATHVPPKNYEVPSLMQKLIFSYNHEWKNYHPIIKAALLHGEFVKIHPFIDGNGRTARLLLNFELLKNGYVPIIIRKEDRLRYYEALDIAHTTDDYELFIALITELILVSEKLWLSVIS